jgi:hypothetical protein
MLAILIALHFIFVHGPDGQRVELNVNEISSVREPRDTEGQHFAKGTNCLVFMTNGKWFGTKEECDVVLDKIKEADPEVEKQLVQKMERLR